METKKFTIDCWAFFGNVDWNIENVTKKVELIYSKGAKLKTLEFFSLPKDFKFQYSDYGIYIARSKDFMVIGYDTEMYPEVAVETILSEIRKHIMPVWGEHFQIEKGNQPFVYCMERFEKNTTVHQHRSR